MREPFQANCLPVLIGSMPLDDHEAAIRMVLENTPQIPLWIQLPVFAQEAMIAQFMPGLPGLVRQGGKAFIDASSETFDGELLEFYEAYLAAIEGVHDLDQSRFALTPHDAKGFFVLLEHLKQMDLPPVAVKGQITGPITFATGVADQDGRAIYYNEQIRDAAIKLLALKARWQIRELSKSGAPVIIFLDEPALAGFGSSELISISRDEVLACLEEVIESIHAQGGLAGIHVCANTDWSMVLESSVDIVNFDAYSYFDRFILYPQPIRKFLATGRILAWGIVPTGNKEAIERETVDSLVAGWCERARQLESLGIDLSTIMTQSLITPSCGAGSLSLDLAQKVLGLTKAVSEKLRHSFGRI